MWETFRYWNSKTGVSGPIMNCQQIMRKATFPFRFPRELFPLFPYNFFKTSVGIAFDRLSSGSPLLSRVATVFRLHPSRKTFPRLIKISYFYILRASCSSIIVLFALKKTNPTIVYDARRIFPCSPPSQIKTGMRNDRKFI